MLKRRRDLIRGQLVEASRRMRLEEARLRSAALATGCGLGTTAELQLAAMAYSGAVADYRELEEQALRKGGLTYTQPDLSDVEVVS